LSPELETKLIEKYPLFFADKDEPLNVSLMSWGCAHGDGWYNLLDEILAELYPLLQEAEQRGEEVPRGAQIKEKFGTLRVYMSKYTDAIHDILLEAEKKSATVCESCGAAGELRADRRWIRTLCDACHKKVV